MNILMSGLPNFITMNIYIRIVFIQFKNAIFYVVYCNNLIFKKIFTQNSYCQNYSLNDNKIIIFIFLFLLSLLLLPYTSMKHSYCYCKYVLM